MWVNHSNILGRSKKAIFDKLPFGTPSEFANFQWLDVTVLKEVIDRQAKIHEHLDLIVPKGFMYRPWEIQKWSKYEEKSQVSLPVGERAWVAQTGPQLGGFPKFGELVPEIQNKIWVALSLMTPGRCIVIREEDVNLTTHPNADDYTVIGARRPMFLNTCKGALSAMVGIYRPMFQLRSRNCRAAKKGVFVNPDIDLIKFIALRDRGGSPPLDYINALEYPAQFAMIRHTNLPIPQFHNNLQRVARIITNLPRLESLSVEAMLDDPALLPGYTHVTRFTFEDVKYVRPLREPRNDMQIMVMNGPTPLNGIVAINFLFSMHPNTTHKATIFESLGRVETLFRQEPNCPDRVFAMFYFRNHW